jgi:hypothetical protein
MLCYDLSVLLYKHTVNNYSKALEELKKVTDEVHLITSHEGPEGD